LDLLIFLEVTPSMSPAFGGCEPSPDYVLALADASGIDCGLRPCQAWFSLADPRAISRS
jgi:hypothetical protein